MDSFSRKHKIFFDKTFYFYFKGTTGDLLEKGKEGVCQKKEFTGILLMSCSGVSFFRHATLLGRGIDKGVFLWILGNLSLYYPQVIAFAWSSCGPKPQTPKRPLNCVVEGLTKSSISCQNTLVKETKFFQNFNKYVKKRFKERSLNIF